MTTASRARSATRIVAEFQFADAARRHAELAQLVAELDAGALLLQQLDRGLDQDRAQALARDQRPAGLPARQQSFPHHRAGEPRRPLGRIDIQRRQQQRLHQPIVQRSLAGDGIADQLALRCPNQRHQCEIIAQARVGYPAAPRRTPTAAAGRRRGRAASAARSRDRRTETAPASARPVRPRCRSSAHRPPRDGCPRAADDCRCRW